MKSQMKAIGKGVFFTALILIVILAVYFLLTDLIPVFRYASKRSTAHGATDARDTITVFAREQGLRLRDWPKELITLLEQNPETEQYVLNYPLMKNSRTEVDLTEYKDCTTVPLLIQWDERWGYTQYGSGMMGLTGCGPTCLSMVCVYLLNDPNLHPQYVANFSQSNGYYVSGSGSAWALISEGGKTLGLDVTELPLDQNIIMKNLKAGNPIICVLGPGDFTTEGHFIVLTGCTDGKIQVNDPNSKIRSARLWDYERLAGQIRNLWVCRRPS